MSKVVRIICLLLVLAMIVTVSACGNGGTNETTTTEGSGTTATTGTTGTTASADPYAEHLELMYMGPGVQDAAVNEANKLVQLALEEKFNITLTFSPAPYYNDPNSFNLIVAAGALADFGLTCLTVKAPELNAKGTIRDILKADVARLMPNYIEKQAERPLLLAWQTKSEEAYFGLYQTSTIGRGGAFTTAVRLDWMENLGLAAKGNVTRLVPAGVTAKDWATDADKEADDRIFVTDYQYTWDEFHALLDGFVNGDPDGNGAKDTYGLSTDLLQFMDGYYAFHIFPIEGMNFRWVKEADGSAAPQRQSLVYKEFLKMHKALADEGLMIPNYWLAEYSDVWQYWAAGQAGAIGMVTGYTGGATLPPYSILYNNTSSKVLMLPPTAGRRGHDSSFAGGSDIGFLFVNASATQAEYERALAIFDYMYFSDEGREFCEYGVEGQNFTWDTTKTPKVRVNNTTEQNDALAAELRVQPGTFGADGYFYWTNYRDLETRYGNILEYEQNNWPAFEGYYVFYGPGSADALAAASFSSQDNVDALEAAHREYVINICEGKMDADTAYEQYMSVCNGLGYQDYLKAVNDSMYITSEMQKGNLVHPSDAK